MTVYLLSKIVHPILKKLSRIVVHTPRRYYWTIHGCGVRGVGGRGHVVTTTYNFASQRWINPLEDSYTKKHQINFTSLTSI